MTAQRLLTGFALFAVLSGAATANIVLMQPKLTSRQSAAVALPAASSTAGRPSSRPEIRQAVVRELYTRGYLSGTETDLGPLVVESAIVAFEYDHGLPLTADPSETVLQGLILGAAGTAGSGGHLQGPMAQRLSHAIAGRLAKLGYPATSTDMASPIKRFERDYRLEETGRISASLMQAINRASAVKGLATTTP